MTSIYQKVAVVTLGAVISLATFEATPSQSIIFNEALSGDLPRLAIDSPVFALDVGTNTFTGELIYGAAIPPTDFDSFIFSIPDGSSLESILFDISLLSGASGFFNRLGYELQDFSGGTPISLEGEAITIPSTNLSLFTLSLPLSPGQFALQATFFEGSLIPGEFETAAYTFSLNVAATEEVPEPSTLVGLACLGLGGLLLKKKTIA